MTDQVTLPVPVIGPVTCNVDMGETANGAGVTRLNGGGMMLSLTHDNQGHARIGVDSWNTAASLLAQYGGVISYGYFIGASVETVAENTPMVLQIFYPQGWGYYWTPPGATVVEQGPILLELGVFSTPSFMDKYGWMVVAVFSAVGAFYAVGAGAAAVETSGSLTATSPEVVNAVATESLSSAAVESAMLGGPAVGTGTELSAAEFAAASSTQAVANSVAANSLAELTPELVSPSSLTTLAKPLASAILPAILPHANASAPTGSTSAAAAQNQVIGTLTGGMLIAGVVLLFVVLRK